MTCRLRGLLRRLHRERRMVGERDEHVQLLIRWTLTTDGDIDGEDAEQVPVGVPHRQEERVLRMPRVLAGPRREIGNVRLAGRAPVELARGNVVRAAAQEPIGEQARPLLDRAHAPEEDRSRLLAAVHGRHFEVVPLRTEQIDDDALVAERLRDRPRDRAEQIGKILVGAHEAADLEQALQRGDRVRSRFGHSGVEAVCL